MSADDAVKAYRCTVAGRNAATPDHKLKSIAKKIIENTSFVAKTAIGTAIGNYIGEMFRHDKENSEEEVMDVEEGNNEASDEQPKEEGKNEASDEQPKESKEEKNEDTSKPDSKQDTKMKKNEDTSKPDSKQEEKDDDDDFYDFSTPGDPFS